MEDRVEVQVIARDLASQALKQIAGEVKNLDAQAKTASRGGLLDTDKALSRLKTGGAALAVGAFAGVTAAATQMASAVVGSARQAVGDFQQSMNLLEQATGASNDQLVQITARAKALGADMRLPATSASDAAQAMLELSKAGLSVSDTMAAARGTLQLSAAANVGNAEAAKINAQALNAFGLAGSEATRVADLLAAGANESAAEITDLAAGLQMSSAIWSRAGFSIDELTTAIAQMANAGVAGSDAGTSLKTMIQSLQAPAKAAQNALHGLGIEVYDSQGNMKDLATLVADFTKATQGLTQAERDRAITTIFGADAARAANIVLLGGVDAYNKLHSAVTTEGAAAAVSEARTKGLKGAVEALSSAAETASLTIGEGFAEGAEKGVRGLAAAITDPALQPALKETGEALGVLADKTAQIVDEKGPLFIAYMNVLADRATLVADALGGASEAQSKYAGLTDEQVQASREGAQKWVDTWQWVADHTGKFGQLVTIPMEAESRANIIAANRALSLRKQVVEGEKSLRMEAYRSARYTAASAYEQITREAQAAAAAEAAARQRAAEAVAGASHRQILAALQVESDALAARTEASRASQAGAREYARNLGAMASAAYGTKAAQEAVYDALYGPRGVNQAATAAATAFLNATSRVDQFNARLANIGTQRGIVQGQMAALKAAIDTFDPGKAPREMVKALADLERQDNRLARSGGWAVVGIRNKTAEATRLKKAMTSIPDRSVKVDVKTAQANAALGSMSKHADVSTRPRTLKVLSNVDAALRGVGRVNSTPVRPKTATVNPNTHAALQALAAVNGYNIAPKTVRVFADTSSARASLLALNSLELGVTRSVRVGSAQFRHSGGHVLPGVPYVVKPDEEVFVPSTRGRVQPDPGTSHYALSGGGGVKRGELVGLVADLLRSLKSPQSTPEQVMRAVMDVAMAGEA